MIVLILLLAMLVVLAFHGFLLRERHDGVEGQATDAGAAPAAFVNSMEDFGPAPRGHGFDPKHWTSLYWT